MRFLVATTILVAYLIFPKNAFAVTYEYIGAPLSADTNTGAGATLLGHPIVLEFSTYNLLPPNLAFDRSTDISPAASVPIINWSLSLGSFQATGLGSPIGGDLTIGANGALIPGPTNSLYFLQFATNSNGTITDWFFYANPVTTDRQSLIGVAIGTQPYDSLLGPYDDFVEVAPAKLGALFTEAAISTTLGSWSLIDPTIIAAPVPELSSWAMLLIGFAGIGLFNYRRRQPCTRHVQNLDVTHSLYGAHVTSESAIMSLPL